MSEKEVKKQIITKNVENLNSATQIKGKKSKTRMMLVLIFIAVFTTVSYVQLRGSYLQYKEVGENFINIFYTNLTYKYAIMGINFIILYILIYFTNRGIKKGLKPFFEKEKIRLDSNKGIQSLF